MFQGLLKDLWKILYRSWKDLARILQVARSLSKIFQDLWRSVRILVMRIFEDPGKIVNWRSLNILKELGKDVWGSWLRSWIISSRNLKDPWWSLKDFHHGVIHHTTSTWTRSILSSYLCPSCRSLSWTYSGLKWWYLKLKEIAL